MSKHENAIDRLFAKSQMASDGDCYRCGKSLYAIKSDAKAAKQFKKMTGRAFPWPSISLNIAAD